MTTDNRNLPLYTSYTLLTDSDGAIKVKVLRTARRYTMRVKDNRIFLTAPAGTTYNQTLEAYQHMRSNLPELKAARTYALGQEIRYAEGLIVIKREDARAEIRELHSRGAAVVIVPEKFRIDDARSNAAVTRAILRLAKPRAANILLPRAREIASRLNSNVREWNIGTGLSTLGTCSSDRSITLSAACLFLTPELRDYIICHELAHLTEMNHSARFHLLCNHYLGGREKELIKALKEYNWPIIR